MVSRTLERGEALRTESEQLRSTGLLTAKEDDALLIEELRRWAEESDYPT